ncbi:hypothetical protein [Euzebya sp.]|uniref:DUF2207 family protein n=1 Tax=Euzebya sp. TaxID=1971409 RepID=UPI0035126983
MSTDPRAHQRELIAVVALVALLVLGLATAASAQSPTDFPGLEAGQRVVDLTGSSLSETEVADLRERFEALSAAGVDGVAVVRALDASPEETLEQVEALQQAWVARTGAAAETAAAFLINRNPDDPTDARAGVFVGPELREGNVGEDEQVAIVEQALIPPLRDGDVHASLAAGIDRLATSAVEGPPVSAAEVWAAEAARGWVLWAALAAAVALVAAAGLVHRRRTTIDAGDVSPTTARPGDLPPAVVAALLAGSPQATAIPATVLDLATRGAVAIEVEDPDVDADEAKAQVRLLDRARLRDDVEVAVWGALEEAAEDGLVRPDELAALAGSDAQVDAAVEARMRAEGWLDPRARANRGWLGVIVGVAAVLLLAVIVIAALGESPLGLVGAGALAVAAITALVLFTTYSRLSAEGQQTAVGWQAYRAGLGEAVHDDRMPLDLDAVLPDLVALELAHEADDRIEAAGEAGQTLAAFTPAAGGSTGFSPAMYVVLWSGFQSSTASASTAGAGSTVSGIGVSGGGGAAGST